MQNGHDFSTNVRCCLQGRYESEDTDEDIGEDGGKEMKKAVKDVSFRGLGQGGPAAARLLRLLSRNCSPDGTRVCANQDLVITFLSPRL